MVRCGSAKERTLNFISVSESGDDALDVDRDVDPGETGVELGIAARTDFLSVMH